jgi:hypothetical protein
MRSAHERTVGRAGGSLRKKVAFSVELNRPDHPGRRISGRRKSCA